MSWIRLMDSNGAEVSVSISPGSVVFAFSQDACEEGCHTHPDRAAEFFREGLRRLEGSANEGERMAQAIADAGPSGPPPTVQKWLGYESAFEKELRERLDALTQEVKDNDSHAAAEEAALGLRVEGLEALLTQWNSRISGLSASLNEVVRKIARLEKRR